MYWFFECWLEERAGDNGFTLIPESDKSKKLTYKPLLEHGDNTILIKGIADLRLETPDKYHIIDFKTGNSDKSQLVFYELYYYLIDKPELADKMQSSICNILERYAETTGSDDKKRQKLKQDLIDALDTIKQEGFGLPSKVSDRKRHMKLTRELISTIWTEEQRMYKFQNSIVTASAGTGKTFRLSVEFISLILNFYGSTDMQPDNILVLTFTRKATAEIRERIISHIDLLLTSDHEFASDDKLKEKQSLISSIRKINPGLPETELTPVEEGKLISLRQIFAADKQQLRVMTIDAYINSIFRNLVRPLRSLDSFEIDLNTADKHLADILNSLMSPRIKNRIDKLLQRKIRPSLDQYKDFIISLIKQRWTYYQIKNKLQLDTKHSLQAYLVEDKSPDASKMNS
jgi:ATP-dependent exoDNAse (exonuclease V) beta subunit